MTAGVHLEAHPHRYGLGVGHRSGGMEFNCHWVPNASLLANFELEWLCVIRHAFDFAGINCNMAYRFRRAF